MVIHYLTIFLQEAGAWSSSLDFRFRDILKKIDDLVIRDETKARIDFENKFKPGKHICFVLLIKKMQNRTLLLRLTKNQA